MRTWFQLVRVNSYFKSVALIFRDRSRYHSLPRTVYDCSQVIGSSFLIQRLIFVFKSICCFFRLLLGFIYLFYDWLWNFRYRLLMIGDSGIPIELFKLLLQEVVSSRDMIMFVV
jgi:hypothetical protein